MSSVCGHADDTGLDDVDIAREVRVAQRERPLATPGRPTRPVHAARERRAHACGDPVDEGREDGQVCGTVDDDRLGTHLTHERDVGGRRHHLIAAHARGSLRTGWASRALRTRKTLRTGRTLSTNRAGRASGALRTHRADRTGRPLRADRAGESRRALRTRRALRAPPTHRTPRAGGTRGTSRTSTAIRTLRTHRHKGTD